MVDKYETISFSYHYALFFYYIDFRNRVQIIEKETVSESWLENLRFQTVNTRWSSTF